MTVTPPSTIPGGNLKFCGSLRTPVFVKSILFIVSGIKKSKELRSCKYFKQFPDKSSSLRFFNSLKSLSTKPRVSLLLQFLLLLLPLISNLVIPHKSQILTSLQSVSPLALNIAPSIFLPLPQIFFV